MSLAEGPKTEHGHGFEIRTSSGRDGYVIQPRGELDLATRDQLHAVLTKALQGSAKRIVLDLKRLEFLDSTGIHLVVLASRTADAQGKQFVLLRGPRNVQRSFELAGIDDWLPFAD